MGLAIGDALTERAAHTQTTPPTVERRIHFFLRFGGLEDQAASAFAAAAMIMFVYLNDHDLECDEDELVDLTVGVATGTTTKAEVAVFLAARMSE